MIFGKDSCKKFRNEAYWRDCISGYIHGTHNPQGALQPRTIFITSHNNTIIGFIAGHLTLRYQCQRELEWIDIIEKYRRNGIASQLVKLLAKWFIEHEAYKICIDPGNEQARLFYKKNDATDLNEHWMFWNDTSVILKHNIL